MAYISLLVILALSMAYGYLNGLHGSASIVATIISSRALKPRWALILAAISISAGPFLLGVAVASTIGTELISREAQTPTVIMAGLIGAIIWSSLTLWLKIPSSISQSLIGGLVGAVAIGFGLDAVQTGGLVKVLVALFLSPLLGLAVGFLVVRLVYNLSYSATPHINRWFNRGQVLVSVLMGISFGANDGQKIIAMMMLGLVATGVIDQFIVPDWVIALSAATIGLGTMMGGWRLIHTLGGKFYKIRPIHGFGAQLTSSAVIFSAGVLGGPVSGSQVVTSAILGAGSADRIQMVRWGVARNIFIGWLLTMPFSALIAAIAYQLIQRGFK